MRVTTGDTEGALYERRHTRTFHFPLLSPRVAPAFFDTQIMKMPWMPVSIPDIPLIRRAREFWKSLVLSGGKSQFLPVINNYGIHFNMKGFDC